ncbi:MAG TPA: AtpZ/AtpI family protein [Kiritimatiellia bacterium]|nr:AtpZ/AtpI family protein [Kiritimatiellia bacterium]
MTTKQDNPNNNRPNDPTHASPDQSAIGLGYLLLAGGLVFVGGGYYIDHLRGGGLVFTLIGVALAFVYGGYEVWKLVRAINADDVEANKKKNHPKS